METTALLGFMSLLLPGYVGLYVSDLIVPAPTRTTFQATAWSLFLSLAGAVVAALFMPQEYLAHLFERAPLSTTALVGTGAQMVSAVAVGGGFALLTKHGLKNRFGMRSVYPTAWDALWSEHGNQSRWVIVETSSGASYSGILQYADDPRSGRAVVLKKPNKWVEASTQYVATGAEFLYFPAEQIRQLSLSWVIEAAKGAEQHEQGQGSISAGDPSGNHQGNIGAGDSERAAGRIPRPQGRAGADDAADSRESQSGSGTDKPAIRAVR